MARKPMVTRSFDTMTCNVLVANISTNTLQEKEITLPTLITEDNKLVKAIREQVETDIIKFVSIKSTTVKEVLLGMSEQDFIKYAIPLDMETRKPLEVEKESEVE